jgi:hypothetical protein
MTFQNFHAVTCLSLTAPVVTLGGFNADYPAGPIVLDNVVVDGVGPPGVAAQFANITLGPGNVNFTPAGRGVTVTDAITGTAPPLECAFPPLPVPEGQPPGWLW